MKRDVLKSIIIEQNQTIMSTATGVQRHQFAEIQKRIIGPAAVIVMGLRRSGKSTVLARLLQTELKNRAYYMSFEEERLIAFTHEDFNTLYELFIELYGERQIICFDEIQNVAGWEHFVRRMQDKGFKFFLTGSNASLLSKELGTKLTGRNVVIELFPFSYLEYLDLKKIKYHNNDLFDTHKRAILRKYFNTYLKNGGLPEYCIYEDPLYLQSLYDDILYRDIVARYEIKEIKALRELGLYLLSNIAKPFSYSRLQALLGLGSVNTVKNYIHYFTNSYLLFELSRFSYSVKQQVAANKKIYCVDNGIMEAIAFQFSKNVGKYLENLVYITLRRQGLDLYYYKTKTDKEVDFVVRKGRNIIQLIQVSDSLAEDSTRQREITALMAAMEETNLSEALLLTSDEEDKIVINKKVIRIISVYKWLLQML